MSKNKIEIVISAKDLATRVFRDINSSLGGIRDRVFNVKTAFAGLAAGIGVAGVGSAVIGTANTFERLSVALRTTEGSSKAAENALAWITEFTATTPYQLSEVGEAFQRLSAYGLDAERELRVLGDTAASIGRPIMDAVEMFADAAQGQFERLKSFGIRASQEGDKVTFSWVQNGQQMQATAKKTQEAISDMLRDILETRYKGAMENFSRTFTGITSNLQDHWSLFLKDIADSGPFDQVKGFLKAILDEVNRLREQGKLKEWAEEIGKAAVEAGRKTISAVSSVAEVFFSILRTLDARPEIVKYGVIGYFLYGKRGLAAGAILGSVAGEMKRAWEQSSNVFSGMWNMSGVLSKHQQRLLGLSKPDSAGLLPPDRMQESITGIGKAQQVFDGVRAAVDRAMQKMDALADSTDGAAGEMGVAAGAADGLSGGLGKTGEAAGRTAGRLDELARAAESLRESLRTPAEVLNNELAQYREFLDKKLLTTEQYAKAFAKLTKSAEDPGQQMNAWLLRRDRVAARDREERGAPGQWADAGITIGGAVNDIASAQWEQLQDAMSKTRDGFADLKDAIEGWGRDSARAIVDFALTGKASFSDMIQSMISDMAQMMLYQTVLRPIFGKVSSMLMPVTVAHSGWDVGSAPPAVRMVDPAIFQTAPKYHRGLMPDEFPAILQRGEKVIPKGATAGGGRVNIVNNINFVVEAPKGADPMQSQEQAERFGAQVTAALDARIQEQLAKHFRVGGMFNRSLGVA